MNNEILSLIHLDNDKTLDLLSSFVLQVEPYGYPSYVFKDGQLYWQDELQQKLTIDFSSPKQLFRYSKLNKAHEPLLRALKWKNGANRSVWDLTAGLGRDGGLLAYSGFCVTFFERNPILQVLLTEAIHALKKESLEMYERIMLKQTSSIDYLKSILDNGSVELPQNLYMDPMYPHRKKSALVKLDLRMVRGLVGDDEDSHELISIAIQLLKRGRGIERVVVKRPAKAEYLGEYKPNYSVDSPNTRFDVYNP